MNPLFIPVNEPLLDGNEKEYLQECIDTGWISSEGPFVKRFEDEFALRCGRKYAVAVANGTAALDIAVEALDIGPGDEVILPTFTIISCIGQIVRAGLLTGKRLAERNGHEPAHFPHEIDRREARRALPGPRREQRRRNA